MENPIKMDDLRVPLFLEAHMDMRIIYTVENWHQGCHDMTCFGDASVFGLRALEPLTNSDWLT